MQSLGRPGMIDDGKLRVVVCGPADGTVRRYRETVTLKAEIIINGGMRWSQRQIPYDKFGRYAASQSFLDLSDGLFYY
jgi:hypothetical protein